MKRILFLSFCLIAVCTLSAQTADEIVTLHVRSIGDLKKLGKIKSLKTVFSTDNEILGYNSSIFVAEVGSRVETKTLFGNTVEITNKNNGWTVYRMTAESAPEVEEMSGVDHTLTFPSINHNVQKLLESNILISYAMYGFDKRYTKVEVAGKETVQERPCYKLKVTYSGDTEDWYIDTETGHCLKKTKKNEEGNWTDLQFSDFKTNQDGLVFPYEVKLYTDDKQVMAITYSEYETNIKADKSLFTYAE